MFLQLFSFMSVWQLPYKSYSESPTIHASMIEDRDAVLTYFDQIII